MSNIQQANFCSKHQLQFQFVNMDACLGDQSKLLCIRCNIENQSTNQRLIHVEEFQNLLKEMKLKQHQKQKAQKEKQILKYNTIQSQINSYQDWINNVIRKLKSQINDWIEKLEFQLKGMAEPEIEKINDEDIILLTKSYQGNNLLDIPQIFQENKSEEEQQFIYILKSTLNSIIQDQKIQIIIHQLNKVNEQKVDEQISQNLSAEDQMANQGKKIRSLKYKCKKHDEKIIMLNLESEGESRLLCAECIPESNQKQLTTVDKANNQWLEYQGMIYENKRNINFTRQQTQLKIIEILSKYQQQFTEIQNELIKLVEKSNNEIKNDIQILNQQFQKTSINLLDLDSLYNAIDQLSTKNQLKELNKYKAEFQQKDQILFNEIVNKIKQLVEVEQFCKEQLKEIIPNQLFNLENTIPGLSDDNKIGKEELHSLNQPQKVMIEIKEEEIQVEQYFSIQTLFSKEIQKRNKPNITYNQIQQISLKLQKAESVVNINQLNQWRFSQQFKHQNIVLSNDCKIAQTNSFGSSVCLCDQAIPLNGAVTIEFKINKLNYLHAGVCQKEQINENYDISVYSSAKDNNNWCYFMYQDGRTFFHQQDYQQHNFKFKQNDIIRMEVNQQMKKITWINKTQNYTPITKDIPMAQDLYFCFRLHGECEIELI